MSAGTGPGGLAPARVRQVIATVLGADLVLAAVGGWLAAHAVPPPGDATVGWVLARSTLAPLLCLALGGWSLFRFARRPARLAAGWAALAPAAVAIFGYVSVVRGFHGHFLHAGAVLLGWLLGGGLATVTGGPGAAAGRADDDRPQRVERWAALGALGALAATHMNAGLAKLLGLGASAAAPWIIQLSLHLDHPVGETSLLAVVWRPVLESASLAGGIAWFFLLAELGAIGLLSGPRARRFVVGVLLLYHLLMSALFGMVLWEAIVLLVVLGGRGGRWARAGDVAGPGGARRLLGAVAGSAVILLLALGLALASLGATGPQSLADTGPPPGAVANPPRVAPAAADLESARAVAALGPFEPGQRLPGGWVIAATRVAPGFGVLELRHDDSRVVHLLLAARDVRAGPFDAGSAVLGYRARTVPLDSFRAAAEQVAGELRAAAGGDAADAVERWLKAAREAPSSATP